MPWRNMHAKQGERERCEMEKYSNCNACKTLNQVPSPCDSCWIPTREIHVTCIVDTGCDPFFNNGFFASLSPAIPILPFKLTARLDITVHLMPMRGTHQILLPSSRPPSRATPTPFRIASSASTTDFGRTKPRPKKTKKAHFHRNGLKATLKQNHQMSSR